MRAMASVFLGVLSLFAALAAGGAPAPSTTCQVCPTNNCQSPRNVNKDMRGVQSSFVQWVSPDQRKIRVGGGELKFCGQHYHAPVENVQGCSGESEMISSPWTDGSGRAPTVGQWIEVHTVYARDVVQGCQDWQSLACCKDVSAQHPAVVRAFSAKVVATLPAQPLIPGDPPIPGQPALIIGTPNQGPLAEWVGSETGPDAPGKPGECKEVQARWSFRLRPTSCDAPSAFKVTQAALNTCFSCQKQAGAKSGKCGWQGARELQGGQRVSTYVDRIP